MPVVIGPINKTGPIVQFYLLADILSQSAVTNQTVVRITRQSWNTGNSGSSFLGPGTQTSVWYNGAGYVLAGQHAANPFLPSGVPGGTLRWSEFEDVVLNHDANGYWLGGTSMSLRMDLSYGSVVETHYGSLTIPRIARVPLAPGGPFVAPGTVTTQSFSLGFSAADGRGASVDMYEVEWATDSGFTSVVATVQNPTGPINSGAVLAPGTGHYARVRAHNAVGWGAWSSTVSQSTLPAVAPGFVVTPALNGASASAAFSPPGGASGVTLYQLEYRLVGGATIDDPSSPTSPIVVGGLTPGGLYEWRGSAFFGSYQSPWTAWTLVAQPDPNTSPGSFFDGNSADVPEITDFGWTSTTNNSTSTATGWPPLGWEVESAAGGVAVMQRVVGGAFGDYSARVVMLRDATAAGVRAGIENDPAFVATVALDGTYFGAISVNPSRAQRMASEITWVDGAGTVIARTVGDSVLAPAGVWTRLQPAIAPAGAAGGLVRAIDVAGAGHSVWLGGEFFLLDGADLGLVPSRAYIDGDQPDTPAYLFEWDDEANLSISYRTVNPSTDEEDPLTDPDCDPIPAPPRPPTIPDDCIIEVGTWRRYWISIPSSEVSDWLTMLPTLLVETGADPARQVRIRYYPNPEEYTPDTMPYSDYSAEQIITYIPPNTEMTIDGVGQRAWADVNGTGTRAADHLLYGTGGRPATWPELTCGTAYLISFDVPPDSEPGNLTVSGSLTQRG